MEIELAGELTRSEAKRAKQLHDEAIVIDGLVPTMAYLSDPKYRNHLATGGITAGNFTIASRVDFTNATAKVEACRTLVEAHAETFMLARSGDEVRTAKDTGTTAVILGFQDSMPIMPTDRTILDGNLKFLRAFAEMGVRVIQLTYNSQNYVGAGCCERVDSGLSNFGRQVVDEMNRLGILIDLSHCGDTTTMDAIEYSDDPIACTHANPRALSNVGRNKTDEQIRALAANNGVIGISLFPPLVKSDPETHKVKEATIEDVLDGIDYIVDLAGVDHVGFGTDMNDQALDAGVTPPYAAYRNFRPDHPDVYGRGPIEHYEPYPRGLHRHTALLNLTRGLFERDYDDSEIAKILGGNFLRVFDEVWG